MGNKQAATWREFLGQMIENMRERQRLAAAVCVNVATLQRWARDQTMPREEHLERLLSVLPGDVYPTFLRLLTVEFPGLARENRAFGQRKMRREIPSEFYQRVLDAAALTPWPMCHQAVQDLILQQLIELLDPERRGLSISLVRCMPPRCGGKVLSLREMGGMGTHPWKHDLEQKMFFFGAESLIGHAVTRFTTCVVNSRDEVTFFPTHWTEYENSAAACPILYHAKVGGGLVASSAREGFFSETHVAILECYADLASLLFDPEDFYPDSEIDLRLMPLYNLQTPLFRDFNQRVSRKFIEAGREGRQIALQEARLAAWQDLEAELLML